VKSLAELMLKPNAVRILKTLAAHPDGLIYSEIIDEGWKDVAPQSWRRLRAVTGSLTHHIKRLALMRLITKRSRRYYITPAGRLLLLTPDKLEEVAEKI